MREILFRGKRIDNGMWVYGSYMSHKEYMGCVCSGKSEPVRHLILYDGCADWDMPITIEYCEVDPATVGQYTGLKDRHGIKIFEGDVCLIEIPRIDGAINRHICRCEFEDGCFVFVSNEEDYWCRGNDYGYHDKARENIEVIGNIYDEGKK